mmetsp:Transcript_17292/g.46876  ORF Transcript_17292/g.46876 Transcript_17292/m.46876 type:complete len:126 (+) Transcript_17292:1068-1445(+)
MGTVEIELVFLGAREACVLVPDVVHLFAGQGSFLLAVQYDSRPCTNQFSDARPRRDGSNRDQDQDSTVPLGMVATERGVCPFRAPGGIRTTATGRLPASLPHALGFPVQIAAIPHIAPHSGTSES